MRVSIDCLPPAYVLLSSFIAYQLLPANFDTKGNLTRNIDPQDAPTLVERDDGTVSFAAVDAYTSMGAPGVANANPDIDIARPAMKPRLNDDNKKRGYHVVTTGEPDHIDMASYPFQLDFERWDICSPRKSSRRSTPRIDRPAVGNAPRETAVPRLGA
ncbi:hypothetical protein SLS54_000172 [Diplodia seriata]